MLYNDPQFLEGRQPEENTESEKSDKTESNEVTEEKPVKETKAPEASEPKKASFKKHQLLDEEYTFDTFIPGDNSRFAYNAAIAVANEPGKSITTRNFWRVVNRIFTLPSETYGAPCPGGCLDGGAG